MISTILVIFIIYIALAAGLLREMRKNTKLSEQLEESRLREEAVKKKECIYRQLLPDKLLGLFRQDKADRLRIGEEKSIRAAVLSYNISDFASFARQQSGEEIFGFVNRILSLVVPCILYEEGEIDEYVDAGLSAFFLGDPEKALRSAISVCEALNHGGIKETFSMGLTYGDVMVGMVGHEKRFGTLTISETTGLADFLQELAIRYRARILITGSMKQQIPDFDKNYHSRYLGNIYMETAKMTEELYDVYDGDEPEDKNGKRKTRLLFENGVELFQNKNFNDARLHFIEVLKVNRLDGAAKEYFYLCNKYLTKADSLDSVENYLDIY